MVEQRRRPGEPGDELEPKIRIGRHSDVVKSEHERSDRAAVHLFMRPIAGVPTDDGGVVAERLRVGRRPTELFRPVRSKPLGVVRVDSTFKGVRQDRVGEATPMPRLSKSQKRVGSAHRLVDCRRHER